MTGMVGVEVEEVNRQSDLMSTEMVVSSEMTTAANTERVDMRNRNHDVYLGIIVGLQQELIKCRNTVSDWRPNHKLDTSVCRRNNMSGLLDPAVNLEIKELRMVLAEYEASIRKLKDELHVANFSSESIMGRRLIGKCRILQSENKDFGKLMAENQLQPLQLQVVAVQKQLEFYRQQMRSLQELNSDLDEENERLTSQVQQLTENIKTIQTESDARQYRATQMQAPFHPGVSDVRVMSSSMYDHPGNRPTSHGGQHHGDFRTYHQSEPCSGIIQTHPSHIPHMPPQGMIGVPMPIHGVDQPQHIQQSHQYQYPQSLCPISGGGPGPYHPRGMGVQHHMNQLPIIHPPSSGYVPVCVADGNPLDMQQPHVVGHSGPQHHHAQPPVILSPQIGPSSGTNLPEHYHTGTPVSQHDDSDHHNAGESSEPNSSGSRRSYGGNQSSTERSRRRSSRTRRSSKTNNTKTSPLRSTSSRDYSSRDRRGSRKVKYDKTDVGNTSREHERSRERGDGRRSREHEGKRDRERSTKDSTKDKDRGSRVDASHGGSSSRQTIEDTKTSNGTLPVREDEAKYRERDTSKGHRKTGSDTRRGSDGRSHQRRRESAEGDNHTFRE